MTNAVMWDRIQEVFEEALEREGAERDAVVRRSCGDDVELLQSVTELLAAHDALEDAPTTSLRLGSLDPNLACALLQDTAGDFEEGALLGRYRIVERAASGGMGVVYRAHDPRLERPVALKLLPLWRTTDPDANRRLEEEARAASALDHPNIATVYEIGASEEERLFIAMMWCEGGTLRDRLADGPLPAAAAVSIARQVAQGLAAAHRRGIAHRDIKPENIAFASGDRAVILDFGIASAVRLGGGRAGTAPYMSPEQARGEKADHRADIWALGTVLAEMLTGKRPAPVIEPPQAGLAKVPPPLVQVIDRCRAEDPDDRFQSADQLLAALDDAAAPARRHPLRRIAGPVAAYASVAAVVFVLARLAAHSLLLPDWFASSVLAMLLAGLPVVAATGLVTSGPSGMRMPPRGRLAGHLTWRKTLFGGGLAFAAIALAGAAVVVGGMPRVTGAHGGAGSAMDERPIVVLADFEASEGADDVAAAAREALAVDLSQSGSVTVYARSQVAAVLRLMGASPGEPFDLEVAREVAQRAGAGAVLTGSVSKMGNQYVLVGRAVEPDSGVELFSVRAAAGEGRLIGAVERLSREMRHRLGEGRSQIRRSRPLPEVSTPSMEALRLYASAEQYHMRQDFDRARSLLEEAIRIDPGFAMAHRQAAATAVSQLSYGRSNYHTTRAFELRERLSERERRHVEAIYYINGVFDPEPGVEAYRLLLSRYPDDARAWFNLGASLHSWLDDSEGAYEALRRFMSLDHFAGFAVSNAAYLALILGRDAEADSLAATAEGLGVDGFSLRWRLSRAFDAGDAATVVEVCDALLTSPVSPAAKASDAEICGTMDVAGGRVEIGMSRLEEATVEYLRAGRHRNVAHAAHGLALGHTLRGEHDRAAARLLAVVENIAAEDFIEPDRYITRINLQVHAALLGRPDVVARIGAAYPPHDDPEHWFVRFADSLVEAATEVHRGNGEAALRALNAGHTEGLMPIGWRIWDALLRGLALEAAARPQEAIPHLMRASERGYLGLPYLAKNRVMLPVALEALVRVEEAAGNAETAAEARERLSSLRSLADPIAAR